MSAIERIADIVRGHEVFIQGHNFPDADSIASAYGIKRLLGCKGIDSDIIYVDLIEKLTINRMLDVLNIDIKSGALDGIGSGGGHAGMAGGFIPISNVTAQIDNDIRVRFLKAFGECM